MGNPLMGNPLGMERPSHLLDMPHMEVPMVVATVPHHLLITLLQVVNPSIKLSTHNSRDPTMMDVELAALPVLQLCAAVAWLI